MFEIFNFTVQYFKLKTTKIIPHQPRGHIANFKVEKNSWVSYGTKVLCFMFLNMYEMCGFNLRVRFLCFLKLEVLG